LTSLPAGFVARQTCPPPEIVESLLLALEQHSGEVNMVAVANGVDTATAIALKTLASTVPDVTVIFLAAEQHDDVARLAGMEQAIGDYILLCTPTKAEIADLTNLISPVSEAYEVVIGRRRVGPVVTRSPLNSILFSLFRAIFRLLTGTPYAKEHPSFRLFSRAAALHLVASSDAEVRIRANEIGPGFPVKLVDLPDVAEKLGPGIGLRAGISRAMRLLVTTSTLPLRATSYLGLLGGVAPASYVLYVVAIWLFKPDVAPGWTTLSLQIAGMMFLFSLIFFLMAEYLVQILATLPGRSRRHLIARELTSQVPRRDRRLNVVDERGQFQLGMPAEYVRKPD